MADNPYAQAHASAEQPDNSLLSLSMLNKASVKIGGKWSVSVWHPFEDKYEYKWQGKARQGANFMCTLVSTENPSLYCQAQWKKTSMNTAKYMQALDVYKHGTRFVMSKVVFLEDAKAAYVNCSIKHVVDLGKTTMDAGISNTDSAVQPAPTTTVAGSIGLETNQFFDLTALVQEVGPTRTHDKNRSSFAVRIQDGSLDEDSQKVRAIPLTVYFDTTGSNASSHNADPQELVSGQRLKPFLEESIQNKEAVSFFCISGAKDDTDKFSFRTTRNTFLTKGTGTKADSLNKNVVLHNLQAADTLAFDLQAARTARDWSLEPGTETRCKLLASFARTATGVSALDDNETIWQCNWVQVSEPSVEQNIKSNDGARLWFPLSMKDESGAIVLYITEQAALKLANVVDAAELEQLHSEGRLRFPFWASVKVWRRPSRSSAEQPGAIGHTDGFDCFIVDAAAQDLQEGFSACSTTLLPMMTQSGDSVLPAALDMIHKSEHYTMAVQYITQTVPPELTQAASKTTAGVSILRPCSRAVALVFSTKRSKALPAGPLGHKLVTDDVVDLLLSGTGSAPKKYTISVFCTLDTITDFKLDPPPGARGQAALISVTGIIDQDTDSAEQPVTSLIVDNIQTLTPEQADALKPKIKTMLYFAALAGQISRKRQHEPWSPDENPSKALTCRTLGRSPTGPTLPEYAFKP